MSPECRAPMLLSRSVSLCTRSVHILSRFRSLALFLCEGVTNRLRHSLIGRGARITIERPRSRNEAGRVIVSSSAPPISQRFVQVSPMDRPMADARNVPHQDGALERHFSIQEIAELWGLSENSVRELFKTEPGVVRIQRPKSRFKRAYTTIRIPRSVLERVHRRMSFVA